MHRVKKQIQPDGWDEGRISDFMNQSFLKSYKIHLPSSGGWLYIFTKDMSIIQDVGNTVDQLFDWVGTPPNFTLYLWWIDAPRVCRIDEFPHRGNVNGGWTIPGNNAIYVYRREEYERVILHEIIHALQWDWHMPKKPLPCWNFTKHDTVSPHLFEAWTELYAEWLYCGWKNIPWEKQQSWQTYQALQILARASKQPVWNENTNVFAYYVLKTAFAQHISFLWTFGNGQTVAERNYVLCELIEPFLKELRQRAKSVKIEEFSLCMTRKTE